MTDRKGEASLFPTTPLPDHDTYVRLHVTPLDAELLNVVLSSALLPKARGISYHTLDTFPEKRYGFLELPSEDAEKLRKKLNGALLKGVKIRIERARPPSIPVPLGQEAMAKDKSRKEKAIEGALPPKDKGKKRKRGAEELDGIVLDDGRNIKRGWTSADEPKEKRKKKDKGKKEKEKKKQVRSKYTDHPECLVKTVLPANAAPLTDDANSTPTKHKKKGNTREVVIHEFEKTTKFPTFLKAVAPTGRPSVPLEYVDGKGWVDEDGNVVESVKARPPPSAKVLLRNKSENRSHKTAPDEESTTGSSDDEEPAEDSGPESPVSANDSSPAARPAESAASFSPSSPTKSEIARPKSSGSGRSLSITIPPATPNESKVHPLEALYKRPKQTDGEAPKTAPSEANFSFFADGNDGNVDEDTDADAGEPSGIQVPLTPFTRHDLELRGVRSAAPTPDTAHPHRRFAPWQPEEDNGGQDEEEPASDDSEDDEQIPSGSTTAQGGEDDGKPASDFQKWFWENRGNLNRSWKKRRKIAGKEKRYRENKARMARAI